MCWYSVPTPEGWKSECTLAGKKVTQIFNPRPGRESNWGPQDWEAEILTTAPAPPLPVFRCLTNNLKLVVTTIFTLTSNQFLQNRNFRFFFIFKYITRISKKSLFKEVYINSWPLKTYLLFPEHKLCTVEHD